MVLDRPWVSWQIRDEQMTAHLRLILFRKKCNKLAQRPFQMFLRYEAFRISHGPLDLWDGADLDIP